MKALVLGASGIIGNHIVRELIAQGYSVFAGSRGVTSKQNLLGLPVAQVKCDLLDFDSLKKAMSGMDVVFQAAAYYPGNTFQKEHHKDVALKGVCNIIKASLECRVKRLVYTSSLTTIGRARRGQLADESMAYDLTGKDPHPYFLVKHLSEMELLQAYEQTGLPVVIVNPTGCFGPYELKPKNMCLIPMLANRELPAYVQRRINVVDTADVARGHVLAAEKGQLGHRYILGAHNTTTKDVIHSICRVAGVKPPCMRVPLRLGLAACYADETYQYLRHKKPKTPILGLRFTQYGQHLSIEKAQQELGYQPQSMDECYGRALAWYQKIGYC